MSRSLFFLIALLLLSAFAFFAVTGLDESPLQLWESFTSSELSFNQLVAQLQKKVFAPGPLRGSLTNPGVNLTVAGILQATNEHRASEGLKPLKLNNTLNQAATNKAENMFALQYFEHESPTGVTPADVVDNVGYEYLQTGENLALGNYESDAALVQAWMDSPGHRENIMKPSYTEIGISAIPGNFEDHHTWMSVQTFATPASACPTPTAKLQAQFEQQNQTLNHLDNGLTAQSDLLNSKNNQLQGLQDEINQLIKQGNANIKTGNDKIKEGNNIAQNGGDIDTYQELWDQGHALQANGETLHEQARTKETTLEKVRSDAQSLSDEYNQQLDETRSLESKLKTIANQLNNQVKTYNKCLEKI